MPTVSSPEVKKLIQEILLYTDEVQDVNGIQKPVSRTKFPSLHVRAYNNLKKVLVEAIEVGVGTPEQQKKAQAEGSIPNSEITWMKFLDYKPSPEQVIIVERHTDEPIELTDSMIKALKWFKEDREVFYAEYSNETLDALDELLKSPMPTNA